MSHEFTINIDASGDYTEEDIKEYLLFCMGFGVCSQENPFIDECCDADISSIELME